MAKKRETVVRKVINRVSVAMIVLNILAMAWIISYAKKQMSLSQGQYLGEIVANITSTVETTMFEYMTAVEILAENKGIIQLMSESNKQSPMYSNSNIYSVLDEMTNIVGNFDGKVEIIALVDVDEDAYIMHNGTRSEVGGTMTTRPYYEAISSKQTIITEPYVHSMTGTMVVSVAAPVFSSNGTVLGCVTLNLPTAFISQLISFFGETGNTWVVDGSNNVLAHPDSGYIGQSYTTVGVTGDSFLSQMANPTGEEIFFELNGVERVGMVGSIPSLGWKMIGGIDHSEFEETSQTLGWVLVIVQITCVAFALVVCGIAVYVCLKPLKELNTAMLEMSKGNLKHELTHQGNDEIGELCDNLRTTMSNLAIYIDEIRDNLDAFGNGDFTRKSELVFLGDFRAIQESTGDFVQLITKTLNDLKGTVDQVSVGSDYVATGSQNLAEGSMKQADSVSQLNDNIASIAQSVSENVKNVKHVNDCSHQAAQELGKNNEKMVDMVKSMEEINRTSEGIQKIIKTIEDVAFQTNILALNAAVEAARAGTAGKGFAVVAEEVRNLSTRTSVAVKETTVLIEETVSAVSTGTKIVHETAQGLTEVIEFVGSFMGALDDITEASEQQAISIEDINQGVHEITKVMQTNSAISEESAATSEELSSQASMMKSSIEQFKL